MSDTRERRGMRSLGRIVSKLTGKTYRRRGFIHTEIITRWSAIVGEELAGASLPQRISFPAGENDPGILHVRVEGARAIELQHMTPLVVERINAYFGYHAVGTLRMSQGEGPRVPETIAAAPPMPDREREIALDDQVARTRNPELRDALKALGRVVHATQQGSAAED